MPAGRPTKLSEEIIRQTREACLLGATNENLAKLFNVATSTIDEWIAHNEAFSGAVKAAKAELDNQVERRLYERATGYSHPEVHVSNYQGEVTLTPLTKHYPPDATSLIFWLKNRRPQAWRDRQEITGADGGPQQFDVRVSFVGGSPESPSKPSP